MNLTWQNYLQDQHAVIENGCVTHFGNPVEELEYTKSGTVIVDLSQLGVIRFSGEDAPTFLQGQLSCDVNNVNEQLAQYGSYCTPKGRMLASFLLWKSHDGYLMQLPIALGASIQKRLSMFVMRAKVKLTDSSDSLIRIGLAGNGSVALIEAILGMELALDWPLGMMQGRSFSIIRLAQHRFELITSIEEAPTLWSHLAKCAKPVGAACWDWLEIRAGIAVILPVTQEQFIPQMTNLDVIGGVSFKKGCYPGQEIVARTQYLGKIKRRMYLAHIPTAAVVMAGDELFSAEMAEQSCGKIVNSMPSPNGGVDVLAVIQIKSIDAGSIHWQRLDGPMLEIIPLPYSLTATD